eukprot:m.144019 g.144019  ORF g.144019 m.144019 type:complete len:109 (-) comp16033_c0_seq10:15-341(-)
MSSTFLELALMPYFLQRACNSFRLSPSNSSGRKQGSSFAMVSDLVLFFYTSTVIQPPIYHAMVSKGSSQCQARWLRTMDGMGEDGRGEDGGNNDDDNDDRDDDDVVLI